MSSYESVFRNLGDEFFKKHFNIPIYQRLYVWENIQVKTLISDLVSTYKHNKENNKEKEYFLGGIVVVEHEIDRGKTFDLIDGQQRFTTLKILRELLGDEGLELDFVVRNNVWEHFKKEDTSDIDIVRMIEAKTELEAGLVKIGKENESDFLQYLKDKVKLVVTTVPEDSDLNKLFELINGRGEQLKQHEILKAKILANIKEEKQYQYGKIWEICANMDDFLEINIKKSIGDSWENHKFNEEFSELLVRIKNNDQGKADQEKEELNTISHIIDNQLGKLKKVITIDEEDEASTKYLSIISFEMFLLYALVSFEEINYFQKMDKKIEFKDKNLIQIFEKVLLTAEKDKFDKFIQHLFNIRIKFDNFIIKNHKKDDNNTNDTKHKISMVKKYQNGNNYSRKIIESIDSSLELLQSMLYHSHTRNTQEWIIPFLKYINSDKNTNLELLKSIDNYLYCQINSENTILERASEFCIDKVSIDTNAIKRYLGNKSEDTYHHISQYWYYKMDWIIYDLAEDKDDSFKFTARNSIEHISPQHPQDENIDIDKVSKEYLNSFGNLFLISGSQNSSVSDEGFKTKISKFFKDKDVKNLKLGLISKYNNWGDDGVKKHLNECIKKVEKYFTAIDKTK